MSNPHCINGRHTIVWEDDQTVGYICPQSDDYYGRCTGTVSAHSGGESDCPRCGMHLTLEWNVILKEG